MGAQRAGGRASRCAGPDLCQALCGAELGGDGRLEDRREGAAHSGWPHPTPGCHRNSSMVCSFPTSTTSPCMRSRSARSSHSEPPDDPPGVYVRSHGFRVTPHRRVAVVIQRQNSGTVVWIWKNAPACRNLSMTALSSVAGGESLSRSDPWSSPSPWFRTRP